MKLWQRLKNWSERGYREHVPASVRELAERHGFPTPNRYIQDAAAYPDEPSAFVGKK